MIALRIETNAPPPMSDGVVRRLVRLAEAVLVGDDGCEPDHVPPPRGDGRRL